MKKRKKMWKIKNKNKTMIILVKIVFKKISNIDIFKYIKKKIIMILIKSIYIG